MSNILRDLNTSWLESEVQTLPIYLSALKPVQNGGLVLLPSHRPETVELMPEAVS